MKFGLIIGRFQPLHKGHLKMIETALDSVDELIIILGSASNGRSLRNPFLVEEIYQSIIKFVDKNRIRVIEGIGDLLYDDDLWISEIRETIYDVTSLTDEIIVFGHDKDQTSYYLKMFPYKVIDCGLHENVHAVDIRNEYFGKQTISDQALDKEFLENFMLSEEYLELKKEFEYIENYKKSFSSVPYPVIFTCVDACVIYNDEKVLLIKRKSESGNGKYALPGGFLDVNETLVEGCLRELFEETGLTLKKEDIIKTRVFDNVNRSQRGRIISNCFVFYTNSSKPPTLKAGDDAATAEWVDIDDNIQELNFHDDHFSIIYNIINELFKK